MDWGKFALYCLGLLLWPAVIVGVIYIYGYLLPESFNDTRNKRNRLLLRTLVISITILIIIILFYTIPNIFTAFIALEINIFLLLVGWLLDSDDCDPKAPTNYTIIKNNIQSWLKRKRLERKERILKAKWLKACAEYNRASKKWKDTFNEYQKVYKLLHTPQKPKISNKFAEYLEKCWRGESLSTNDESSHQDNLC